jgi:nickel-dependent lactate racemase
MPSDRVVLALDHGMPQAAQITAAVIGMLIHEAGVDPDGIAVLQTQADAEFGDPCRLLDAAVRSRVQVLTHDPADRTHLAYLAATAAGDPILLHRALHEADLVLPIGCLRRETAAGWYGIHGAVYPTYSDQRALARFRAPAALAAAAPRHRKLVDEANEVAWLLGLNFTVQAIPGADDTVLQVLAGQSESVAQRGAEAYRGAWGGTVARPASLAVAAIGGGPSQQTWENLGRALAAAQAVVEDGGAIAVCCELQVAPGPAVQRMAGARSREGALRRIERELPPDALAAAQLAAALENGSVYLLSRLDPALCERLDVIPIGVEELRRLARRHASCVLLANAPNAIVTVDA